LSSKVFIFIESLKERQADFFGKVNSEKSFIIDDFI